MSDRTAKLDLCDLRARISSLRQELSDASLAYRAARTEHRFDQAFQLLRRKSALMRELLEAQSELLLLIRAEPAPSVECSGNPDKSATAIPPAPCLAASSPSLP